MDPTTSDTINTMCTWTPDIYSAKMELVCLMVCLAIAHGRHHACCDPRPKGCTFCIPTTTVSIVFDYVAAASDSHRKTRTHRHNCNCYKCIARQTKCNGHSYVSVHIYNSDIAQGYFKHSQVICVY